VESIFLIQLIGVLLAAAGLIALTASARVFGSPLSPAERRRATDEWNRRSNRARLPLNPETILSGIFFLAGIGILVWSKFEHCAFLAYWLPSLPPVARVLLACP
jgi:hypothetical protein